MALIDWDEKFETKIKSIDLQHRKLIELINELHSTMTTGKVDPVALEKIVEELASYTSYHFEMEEKYMTEHDYEDYDLHKSEHEKFIEKVSEFKKEVATNPVLVSIKVLSYLKEWITDHILKTDKKYVSLLSEKL